MDRAGSTNRAPGRRFPPPCPGLADSGARFTSARRHASQHSNTPHPRHCEFCRKNYRAGLPDPGTAKHSSTALSAYPEGIDRVRSRRRGTRLAVALYSTAKEIFMSNERTSHAGQRRTPTSPASAARPATTSRSRAGSAARTAIVTMLKEDHKRVKKAFRAFEKLNPEKDSESCLAIIRAVCGELTIHAELEESYLYPAARESLAEDELIDEALVEHASLKRLIIELLAQTGVNEKMLATFNVLREYVEHHVKEEEEEMFPKLAQADADWPSIQDAMLLQRHELESLLKRGKKAN